MADYSGQDPSRRRGGLFDEIRRQMEEMMAGTRRPTPTALPGTPSTRRGGTMGQGEHVGMAVAAMAGYWALPMIARGRKRRRRRARPSDSNNAQS